MDRFAILKGNTSPLIKKLSDLISVRCPECWSTNVWGDKRVEMCDNCGYSRKKSTKRDEPIDIEIFDKKYYGYLDNMDIDMQEVTIHFFTEDAMKAERIKQKIKIIGKEIHFHGEKGLPIYLRVKNIFYLLTQDSKFVKISITGTYR